MSDIILEAQARTTVGKGASRRLRRLENQVPAIIYGGKAAPQNIVFQHNKIIKALEDEAIYASVLTVKIGDTHAERVILKAMQRHPWKPIVMHMDLQRVNEEDVLNKMVPIHFINEENSLGVKAGGLVSHTMTQVEVHCKVRDLPEYIEVDLSKVKVDDVIHLSDLKLPHGVTIHADLNDGTHDLPVLSIHKPKVATSEQVTEEEIETEVIAAKKNSGTEEPTE